MALTHKIAPRQRGRSRKHLDEYLLSSSEFYGIEYIKYEEYARCPATTFLRYAVDAKDAIEYCKKYFQTNSNGDYNKDSKESLIHISAGLLPSLMGHFETFQKSTFAGVFEYSRYFEKFDTKDFLRKIEKVQPVSLDISRTAAYRGQPAPIGQLLADSLTCWHSPGKVNLLISGFDEKVQFFDNDAIEDLSIIWQLRHSIVHTGGWLTAPDSQKVKRLSKRGERPVIFNESFINALSKRMHHIVKSSMNRLETAVCKKIFPATMDFDDTIERFFKVESKNKTWLNGG